MKVTSTVTRVPVVRMVENTEHVAVVTLNLPPRVAETLLVITQFVGGIYHRAARLQAAQRAWHDQSSPRLPGPHVQRN